MVIDASSRDFHALGSDVLREAIVRADELRVALNDRDQQLAAAGYHSQVLVPALSSLLFLFDGSSGARVPLRRTAEGGWHAARQPYSTAELLAILDAEPERLSPNALLRPVFQDAILPTSAYVGGPAEIAYFAQSQVLYERILGRTTPILPRLSATLIEPAIAGLLARHEVSLPDVIQSVLRTRWSWRSGWVRGPSPRWASESSRPPVKLLIPSSRRWPPTCTPSTPAWAGLRTSAAPRCAIR